MNQLTDEVKEMFCKELQRLIDRGSVDERSALLIKSVSAHVKGNNTERDFYANNLMWLYKHGTPKPKNQTK